MSRGAQVNTSEVFDDDSYVVHPLERHVSNVQGVVPTYKVSPSWLASGR